MLAASPLNRLARTRPARVPEQRIQHKLRGVQRDKDGQKAIAVNVERERPLDVLIDRKGERSRRLEEGVGHPPRDGGDCGAEAHEIKEDELWRSEGARGQTKYA